MYAIIRSGGKQYTVKPGDILRVEKLDGELGAELELTDVLMVGGEKVFVGAPTVSAAKVTVVVTNQQRGPKIVIFKKKRRQGYRRTGGHRQSFTELFIKAITSPEGKTAQAETQAKVFDPKKKAEQAAKTRELQKQAKSAGGVDAVTAAPKAAKKKVAKKAGGSKSGKRKTAGKKTAKGAKKTSAKKD